MVDQALKDDVAVAIRRATAADGEAIIAILEGIASERIYTAINRPWSADEQRQYLVSLSAREAIHVAEQRGKASSAIRLWNSGRRRWTRWPTWVKSVRFWRLNGGAVASVRLLFQSTLDFAKKRDYLKFAIQVRSSNVSAQAFYQRLGFRECGRLTRQVRIGEQEDDEVIMEFFL